MRIFSISPTGISETAELPKQLPASGYLWIACARREFEVSQAQIQATLQALCGMQLVDLHVSDLINNSLPSHYEYTSQYDVLVFRRLAAGTSEADLARPGEPLAVAPKRGGPPVLKHIDTSPVGFAVFDKVLLTVHPTDCTVRDAYAARLLTFGKSESRAVDSRATDSPTAESHAAGARLPTSPADLMLRIINQMVDGFLELRRTLTHQLDHWQNELINPRSRFTNWQSLLDTRLSLHNLDEVCEDQRAALQDWIEALKTWPDATTPAEQRERDLLHVRSRDVLEHIERVVHHVQRLEQSAETAVQIHFSVQGSRTNDIMRTLTVLTAIFLPLNLITGFFGMNFEFLPLIHNPRAFWWTFGVMVAIAITTVLVFWRKRYLARTGR
jgi:magnesium transporter